MDSAAYPLQQIMPNSLDDIIRTNRDKVKAYLSTDSEIEALKGSIPITFIKGELSDWAFITFFMTATGLPMVYLTGSNEAERSSWMTSLVVAIEGDAVATTSGSVYKLKGDKSDTLDLPCICATLNSWGVGQKLGVPPFFF
jgi:hypothetical protein